MFGDQGICIDGCGGMNVVWINVFERERVDGWRGMYCFKFNILAYGRDGEGCTIEHHAKMKITLDGLFLMVVSLWLEWWCVL